MTKNRATETIPRILAIAIVALVLFTGTAAAYVNPIPMLFKSQYPPGTSGSASQNCGPASTLMVLSYYDDTTPTEQGIKDIDTWLFGSSTNNWNGYYTSPSDLLSVATGFGGRYGTYPSSYRSNNWNINMVKQRIDAGQPVIVEVMASRLSNRGYNYTGIHYVVAKGYDATHIIANDPGTVNGNSKYYLNNEFTLAMSDAGGNVVVVVDNPITVTSPNGGESWRSGSFQTIKWSYGGSTGSLVSIDLLKYPLKNDLIFSLKMV